jgi:hypothetical protein
MDVVIDEVVAKLRVADRSAVLDEGTIAALVRAVMAGLEERDVRARRRSAAAAPAAKLRQASRGSPSQAQSA